MVWLFVRLTSVFFSGVACLPFFRDDHTWTGMVLGGGHSHCLHVVSTGWIIPSSLISANDTRCWSWLVIHWKYGSVGPPALLPSINCIAGITVNSASLVGVTWLVILGGWWLVSFNKSTSSTSQQPYLAIPDSHVPPQFPPLLVPLLNLTLYLFWLLQ